MSRREGPRTRAPGADRDAWPRQGWREGGSGTSPSVLLPKDPSVLSHLSSKGFMVTWPLVRGHLELMGELNWEGKAFAF